jgi:hypothetical protein
MSGGALLIIAHPGHELLVHDWMERMGPRVCVLTDGSGGQGASRLDATRDVIAAAGADIGPLFGVAPDRAFYQAILTGDVAFLANLVRVLADDIAGQRPSVVLSDAVEHFNPVHDLASVIATLAVRRAGHPAIRRLEFPIERPPPPNATADGWQVRRLTPEALQRKRRAAAEQPRLGAEEVLMPVAADRPLLPAPIGEPYYETFGRARIAQGVYGDLVTFAGHLAPLVAAVADAVSPGLTAARA